MASEREEAAAAAQQAVEAREALLQELRDK